MEALITGLIWLLIYALVIGIVCFVVAKLIAQFVEAARPFVWIVWCIGGLILLLFAIQLLKPVLPGAP